MLRCSRCVLPETFPGIQFDEHGVCTYCRRTPGDGRLAERRGHLRERFEALIDGLPREGRFDVLMGWSGGKDSTYTLGLLRRRYGLRVLAFSFDHGFVSAQAQHNMEVVSEALGVDLIVVRPRFDLLRRLFAEAVRRDLYPVKALERASGVCNVCMSLAKGIALQIAIEQRVPIVAYGWSPGQIPLSSAIYRPTVSMLRRMLEVAMAPLRSVVGDAIEVYFPDVDSLGEGEIPTLVSPLAFFPYDEGEIEATIAAWGWQRPLDTDPHSSNCLLNAFGCAVHRARWGYHPYAMELAGLVRDGVLSREEALARLEDWPDPTYIEWVCQRLGLVQEEILAIREVKDGAS